MIQLAYYTSYWGNIKSQPDLWAARPSQNSLKIYILKIELSVPLSVDSFTMKLPTIALLITNVSAATLSVWPNQDFQGQPSDYVSRRKLKLSTNQSHTNSIIFAVYQVGIILASFVWSCIFTDLFIRGCFALSATHFSYKWTVEPNETCCLSLRVSDDAVRFFRFLTFKHPDRLTAL